MEKENALNIATLASVTTTLTFIQSQLSDIRADLKSLQGTFASKEELAATARATEARIVRLENESNLWRWLSPTLSAVLASIITFFIVQYFLHYH